MCRRQPGDDNRMLVCDTCDKGYHTFCLHPVMTSIPKNGWKCTVRREDGREDGRGGGREGGRPGGHIRVCVSNNTLTETHVARRTSHVQERQKINCVSELAAGLLNEQSS